MLFWHPGLAGAARGMPGGGCWRFQPEGEGFWEVGGASRILAARLAMSSVISTGSRPDAVVASAESIARVIDGPVWEICADASGGGLLAIGAAFGQQGPAVAIAAQAPNAFGLMVGKRWGVRMRMIVGGEAAAKLADSMKL